VAVNPSARPGVALVYPYFRSRDPVEKLFPPLGIACLAGQLRERGVPVRVVDCTFETFDAAVDAVADARPAIVGISVMVTMSRNAFDLLAALRERLPAALFVAGGPLPTVRPRMFAEKFDLVFRGESDVTFPDFCRDYLAAGEGAGFLAALGSGGYPGIHAEIDGRVVATPPVHHPAEVLDRLPLPDRSGFDHRRYGEAMERSAGLRQTSMIITRGCPFSCDFCSKPVWGNLFRKPPLEKVFREIDAVLALGYTALWIADDCFTLDTDYLAAFCRGLIRRGAPVGWTCLSRVERVTPGLVDLMKRAGCLRVYLGLESGSDETLRLMNKRITVDQGARAVEVFAAAGVGTAGFFMVGYPGETVEDVEATFAHALSLPLDEISFTVPLPLPGTPLYARVADPGSWEDWEVSNQVKFVFPSAFDEAWLGRRIAETMAAFERKKGGADPGKTVGRR
jgi:anaerobic magnesium-protoporphyrin IX monomethyl ester cyclase